MTDASPEEIVAALMLAISLGNDDISEKIIRSPMYAKMKDLNKPTPAAQVHTRFTLDQFPTKLIDDNIIVVPIDASL